MHIKSLFPVLLFLLALVNTSAGQQLRITSPRNGDTFKEGDTVKFVAELTGDPTGQIYRVSLLALADQFMGVQPQLEPSCFEITTHPRYSCRFTIPYESTKTIVLSAIGKTPTGAVLSPEVVINVVFPANAVLQQLKSSETVFLYGTSGLGSQDGLLVVGKYSDGHERDLRQGSTGTRYSSSDPKIVTVDADGLVTAHSLGKAQIIVTNSDKKIVITVIVKAD